jgi:hypothetical protein
MSGSALKKLMLSAIDPENSGSVLHHDTDLVAPGAAARYAPAAHPPPELARGRRVDAEDQLEQRRLAAARRPTIATDSPGSMRRLHAAQHLGSPSA